jgi:hypothetical protein
MNGSFQALENAIIRGADDMSMRRNIRLDGTIARQQQCSGSFEE